MSETLVPVALNSINGSWRITVGSGQRASRAAGPDRAVEPVTNNALEMAPMSAVALRGAADALRLLCVRVSWPLIGRSKEMRLIEAAILASGVSGIVVSGAANPARTNPWHAGTSSAVRRACSGCSI
jgi:hypothetical protein